METAAYWIALLTVIAFPPFLLLWFVVHPFAPLWRRLGATCAYAAAGSTIAAITLAMYLIRGPLLRIRFGVRWPLVCLALPFLLAGLYIGVRRFRLLTPSIMFGLPEVSRGRGPGRLLTEGIYSQLRHPRYAEVGLVLASVALFCNYLAVYVLLVLYAPVIYVVVVLEERELTQRFGEEYRRYSREVPRFLPRLRSREKDPS